MADHDMIHAATCNSWWNTLRSTTSVGDGAPAAPVPVPVQCSAELTGFGWPALSADVVDAKSRTSDESPGSLSNSSNITFQDSTVQVSDPAVTAPAMMDSSQLLMGVSDWNQPFLSSGFHSLFQDPDMMSSRTSSYGVQQEQLLFRSNQSINHVNTTNPSSPNLLIGMQGAQHDHDHNLLSGFGSEMLLSPSSHGFQSPLLRSLIEPGVKYNRPAIDPLAAGVQDATATRFPQCNKLLPSVKEPLQFTNDARFWNPSPMFGAATAEASSGLKRTPSVPKPANLTAKSTLEGVGDSSSIITKKANAEPSFKKPRIETPSPLPTFKVRKEKLGDRITALQQLVSPFGKTDTASVLHETIVYIKFLHDQVGALSAPYLKNGHQVQQLKSFCEKSTDAEAPKRDLRTRGLCLVPISSTFAVASEVPVDFWAPAFGGSFR